MTKKSNIFKNFRISYNAPVTLTFSLLCVMVLIVNYFTGHNASENDATLISSLFSTPSHQNFDFHAPLAYFRLIFHIFAHENFTHLVSNLAFILLLGPAIEDRYGSFIMALMMFISALVSGVLNACFSKILMIGSNDIVFMMILLTSFASFSKSEIPLSFILILILYIGRELFGRTTTENITTIAFIAGGLSGSLFAFLAVPKSRQQNSTQKKNPPSYSQKKPPRYNDDDTTVVGSIEV